MQLYCIQPTDNPSLYFAGIKPVGIGLYQPTFEYIGKGNAIAVFLTREDAGQAIDDILATYPAELYLQLEIVTLLPVAD